MAPIPITIVTGFLGSGKTTLILNLIPQLRAQNPDYKLALLKNEFGDLAVDSQLAANSAISGVQELLNGCICYRHTRSTAFPATLALEVNRLARESGKYILDGVISVIDVENWKGYEDTSYTARIQARYTDLIVFNKWENVSMLRYDECLDRVGDLEVDVAKVKSDKGKVSMDLIFGMDGGLAKELTEAVLEKTNGHSHDHSNGTTNGHSHDHQSEVEVLSVVLKADPSARVSTAKLIGFLSSAPKDEAYRIKALVSLSSTPTNSDPDIPPPEPSASGRYILNWAFGRWTFTPVAESLQEHDSSSDVTLRMTIIFARYESNKWKKRIEAGGLIELEGGDSSGLAITKIL
ncbi:Putative GTP-binding protein YjiA [Fusarium oxysporum f. sp. cubense race 1]|uniref:Putative GTP-binding protein YjiA n=1 Tax=Fusarium oxysporum f. sp. cubense (strain race 1) TaxID=1229664 RepID=N4U031_FUSC1|nr:Putative GTP-binding protein YjiA [Fusarium oxysporum f. sp. cubense race 1]